MYFHKFSTITQIEEIVYLKQDPQLDGMRIRYIVKMNLQNIVSTVFFVNCVLEVSSEHSLNEWAIHSIGDLIQCYLLLYYFMNAQTPTFDRQPFQKIQEAYFQYQKRQYRDSILKKQFTGNKYYVSFCAKKDTVLSHPCQLIVLVNANSSYFLGYALTSSGFPFDSKSHPIYQQNLPFDNIQQIHAQDKHLIVRLEKISEQWKFKFDIDGLPVSWKKLMFDMKQRRLQKAGQILLGKREGKIDGLSEHSSQHQQKSIQDSEKGGEKGRNGKQLIGDQQEYQRGNKQKQLSHEEKSKRVEKPQQGSSIVVPDFISKKQHMANSLSKFNDQLSQKINIKSAKLKPSAQTVEKNDTAKKDPSCSQKKKNTHIKLKFKKGEEIGSSQGTGKEEETREEDVWRQRYEHIEKEYSDMMISKFIKDKKIDELKAELDKPNNDIALKGALEAQKQIARKKDEEIQNIKRQIQNYLGQQQEQEIKRLNNELGQYASQKREMESAKAELDKHLIKEKIERQVNVPSLLGEVISSMKKKVDSKEKTIEILNSENSNLREKAKSQSKSASESKSRGGPTKDGFGVKKSQAAQN